MNQSIVFGFAIALLAADDPQTLFDRGVRAFHEGKISESVADFDRVAELVPGHAPQLWQRGIALYYAGRYADCRKQFESHRTVNPNDVENAAWHFLCVARAESPTKARSALLPVGPDSRVPMTEIYQMFRGEVTPANVLAAGTSLEGQFYARLYAGLYYEAIGDKARALENIRIAAEDKYAVGGYMHSVARVHRNLLQARATAPSQSEVWTFDRLDRLGSHKTTILGAPRVIDTPIGKAVQFDGVDDAIFVDAHPLAGAETFTWEVIFRPDGDGAREQRFFHMQEVDPKTGTDTQTRLLFETRVVNGQWYLDSFAFSATGSRTLMDSTKVHPTDRWYHIAMVYDGKLFRNYVNGELQNSAEAKFHPQGAGRTSAGVRINKRDYFKGAIQMSRITRRALSTDEFLKPPKN